MRSEVMYRDLPGGPLLVKFADEVSLWCLCSKCGMFSKDMFQDSASHVFCSVCIFECSAQKQIHCKHERRDVPVDDMVQAVNVDHVMRDQIVFCPNSKDGGGCAAFCALKDLEGHYLTCAETKINCLSCGREIKGLDWERHISSCPQQILQCRYCALAVPRCGLEAHERMCYDNPGAVPVLDSSNSWSQPYLLEEIKENFHTTGRNDEPEIETQRFHDDVDSDDSLLECIYCKRKVKRKNMEHHIKKCSQNKTPSPTSTARKLPGNVVLARDSRKHPILGSNDRTLEATPLQNSSASCDTHPQMDSWIVIEEPAAAYPPSTKRSITPPDAGEMAEEAQEESGIWQYGEKVARAAMSLPAAIISRGAECLWTGWSPKPRTNETLQDSSIGPGVTTRSSATKQYQGTLPPWPTQPCYRDISEWFRQLDVYLEQNNTTNEERKYAVLATHMPESFRGAFHSEGRQPNPYTATKSVVLGYFSNQ